MAFRFGTGRQQWLSHPAAGVLVVACAALAVLSVVQLLGPSQRTAELLFVPKEGMLTRLTHGNLEGAQSLPRMTQLSGFDHRRRAKASSANDLAWAQQLLSTGSSYAERSTETDLVQSDRRSYSTRRYHNQKPGYTSVLPEGSSSADDSAYAMAAQIQQHQDEIRANPQAASQDSYQQQERQSDSSQLYDRPRKERAVSSHHKELQLRLGPFTSAVSESSPSSDSSANAWASQVFQNGNERQMRVKPQARNIELAQTDGMMFQARAARSQQLEQVRVPQTPYTASVREGPAHHDEKAWGWAAEMLQQRRLNQERAKLLASKKSASSLSASHPSAAAAKITAKLRRKIKLQAARQAIVDVHQSSQMDESEQYAEDQKEEKLRVQQIAQREKAQREAAKEGSQEESDEYASILN